MIETTIGGKRLGAGKQQKAYLHNYERSTFNLGRDWRSTMAVGVLTPFFTEIGLPGDQFDIDLNALVKTLPTQTPLFGTFKLQIDMFRVPIRLYQKLLHNNQKGVGLAMDKVYLPMIDLCGSIKNDPTGQWGISKFNDSSLSAYLGMRGIGSIHNTAVLQDKYVNRKVLAIPYLAYYDIFANYYCNKQEKNAYVLKKTFDLQGLNPEITTIEGFYYSLGNNPMDWSTGVDITIPEGYLVTIKGKDLDTKNILVSDESSGISKTLDWWLENTNNIQKLNNQTQYPIVNEDRTEVNIYFMFSLQGIINITNQTPTISEDLELVPFPLENLDKMRMDILEAPKDVPFLIDRTNEYLPYSANTEFAIYANGDTFVANDYPMNGLLVKTYQSDIFNNWLSKEWIDGTNGIAEITSIDVSDGLKIDDLNLAKKVYNMLNRIAVSGGSMYDYIEAVYGVNTIGGTEIPIYEGGMSSEIVFSEIVSSAETASYNEETGESNTNALGTLAGKGGLNGKKGGHVKIYCNEWSVIMGIVSITPRIDYSQGNMWYMTELQTFDDFHKPALDEIGFQNLMSEQMDFRTANYKNENGNVQWESQAIGKIPAWMNYMTSFNQVYGEFVNNEQAGTMVLKREYDIETINSITQISDATTYIDPEKYNYPFAYRRKDAQNYWVQIAVNCKARRKMSAKVIPNL